MADVHELARQSRAFADKIQDLLNRTVCEYARFGVSVQNDRPPAAVVGTCVSDRTVKSSPVELQSAAMVPLWLDVSYRVELDEYEQKFLTVGSSFFGISVGPEGGRKDVLHYDYERGKLDRDGYPEAHLQVYGSHPEFITYAKDVDAKDQLGRYHLPVGGRRMRPALEDLLEFLIVENLVEPHPGWETVLDVNRKEYRRQQIKALVRRNPRPAIEELERLGYTVTESKDKSRMSTIRRILGLPTQGRGKSKAKSS